MYELQYLGFKDWDTLKKVSTLIEVRESYALYIRWGYSKKFLRVVRDGKLCEIESVDVSWVIDGF